MKGAYIQKNSPYYWIRYYDVLEQNPERKRKSLNTKIEVTEADRKRKERGETLKGTPELANLLKSFKVGLAQRNIESKAGIKFFTDTKLSEGLDEFLFYKPDLKPKTIQAYEYAVNIMLKAIGDKKVYKYTKKDFILLLHYLEEQNFSKSTRAIITRHLHPIWNYFIKKNYCRENIIDKIKTPHGIPDPIPGDDVKQIIEYYEGKENDQQLFVVKFLLLTGFRPSSAIVQQWDWIDLDNRIMRVRNVKSDRFFYFPIHDSLFELLSPRRGTGNVLGYERVDSLRFFRRDIEKLFKEGKIRKKYSLYNLRDTFASYLANHNLDISNVQELMNHQDQKITREHYATVKLEYLRGKIDDANFGSLF